MYSTSIVIEADLASQTLSISCDLQATSSLASPGLPSLQLQLTTTARVTMNHKTDDLSDDFVTSLLLNEAKDRNIRYSALGLQAFLPKRSVPHATPTTNRSGSKLTNENLDRPRMPQGQIPASYATSFAKPTATMPRCSRRKLRRAKSDCGSCG